MRIDSSIPAVDLTFGAASDISQVRAENREVIQAVRAVNASQKLGDANELQYFLDNRTRRVVIKIVNRDSKEVVQQIPNDQVLRLAENLK